ncbi:MAG TPA: hypothetical protein VNO14_06405 [Blastocatellia bacterium]|nr:hypothetical protein [Blastocatellia bacterium]
MSTMIDALISLLKTAINAETAQAFGHLVLYTSFGVVRGRTGIAFAQELASRASDGQDVRVSNEVIELLDVSVEHYSNHLPTASFDRLYVRLSDIKGFTLDMVQGQG